MSQAEPVSIVVLGIEGCSAYQETCTIVSALVKEKGLHANVSRHIIQSADDARQYQFLGSPTLRVRGRDVDVYRQNDRRYGYQSRLYYEVMHGIGASWTRVPTRDMVLRALTRYGAL